jgi:glycosyltransferase involved in cell wall biosynthesis
VHNTFIPDAPPGGEDLVCFSHLRWNFVFQRPQHLLTRFARDRRVFFFEEPVYDVDAPTLAVSRDGSGVTLAVPHLRHGATPATAIRHLRDLVDAFFRHHRIDQYVLWYYTPMALRFSEHLEPIATVYDCMDELSGFAGAPDGLREAEAALFRRADVVLTGGQSLYEAKRHLHHNIHPVPSSVDVPHFARARQTTADPWDQAGLARPRLGFCGVIDERLDRDLLAGAAALRPEWQFVMIGPIVKIDPTILPRRPNIHYLGAKSYAELPAYLAGWDAALLPFARNDATRFISPTKTPEYLAAGRPVISTSIRDVVRPYGELGLARIADTPETFVAAIAAALAQDPVAHREASDAFLARLSWNATWATVSRLLQGAIPKTARRVEGQPACPGLSAAIHARPTPERSL